MGAFDGELYALGYRDSRTSNSNHGRERGELLYVTYLYLCTWGSWKGRTIRTGKHFDNKSDAIKFYRCKSSEGLDPIAWFDWEGKQATEVKRFST